MWLYAGVKDLLMKCQYKGCTREGLLCIPLGDTTPCEFYCVEHAFHEGYCYACGGFFAGIESFEFSRSGLCDECQDELDEDVWDENFDDETDEI